MFDSEEAYQQHLDAHPDDHAVRVAFADFLATDPRGAGHRALALLKKFARRCDGDPEESRTFFSARNVVWTSPRALPETWFKSLAEKARGVEGFSFGKNAFGDCDSVTGASRRGVEDFAARVFGRFRAATQERVVEQMLERLGRGGGGT
ncbi:hypothetical protein [Limnoglobus roseus]|uniref:Uncharacterized protein n=1 Tax=Limnoglobus roseus TaxID=2598579 RepID=A0A5C1ALP4_9BACT|nr:hypothetical protein [Limnoglobus roseus]QEL19073.1 hypothetical protein PX52LOC_06130 [Limnoglobus roseus]